MQEQLGDLTFVQIFIDDITIHSKTIEEHFKQVVIVLNRLIKQDQINIKKCIFFTNEHNEIKMDPSKIAAIETRAAPKNIKQLQSFWLCILSQEEDNKEVVIAYASRILKAKIHFGITEKECLALVWAIKHDSVHFETRFEINRF